MMVKKNKLTEDDGRTHENMAEVMVGPTKQVCGVSKLTVENSWTIGYEQKLKDRCEDIKEVVRERDGNRKQHRKHNN